MKVLQIMPEFGMAGAETMCETLTYELMKRGVSVIVISLYNYESPITRRLINNGVDLRFLSKKPGLDLTMYKKLYNIIKEEKPDVIHTHRYTIEYAMPVAVLLGVKHKIHTVHNIAKEENTKIVRLLNRILFKRFRVVPIALSSIIQNTVKEEYNLPASKIPIIFNGIALDNCISKQSYEIESSINFLHVGRFSKQKNHRALIEGFAMFQKKYPGKGILNLVGEGELKKEIEEYVKEIHLDKVVKFLGVVDSSFEIMNLSDIFILPSNYEGMPITLIEAMGTGLPIIASEVGGILDMLTNREDAIIIAPNAKSIFLAMERLSTDSYYREKIGRNAKIKSVNFSASNMCEMYIKVYEDN